MLMMHMSRYEGNYDMKRFSQKKKKVSYGIGHALSRSDLIIISNKEVVLFFQT